MFSCVLCSGNNIFSLDAPLHDSTVRYQKGQSHPRHQSMHMGLLRWIRFVVVFFRACTIITKWRVLIQFMKSCTFPPQLQTVLEALVKLSFSGPVKSTYPQTFLELNQVFLSVSHYLLYDLMCFLICTHPFCSPGVWLCALQDFSSHWLQQADSSVISPEWHPRSCLCVRGWGESDYVFMTA